MPHKLHYNVRVRLQIAETNESSVFVGTPARTAQMECPQAECSRAWGQQQQMNDHWCYLCYLWQMLQQTT